MTQDRRAWFEFRIEETHEEGVEASKLSRLLQDLSTAFYALARAQLGRTSRPGPYREDEESLAAVRILRVLPGSMIIEAEPPIQKEQGSLPDILAAPTPEDVAIEFIQEFERYFRARDSVTRPEIRRRIQQVMWDAGQIGSVVEVVCRPRSHRPNLPSQAEYRARVSITELTNAQAQVTPHPRTRNFSGHVYMVDVEPGRWRIRVKLPDGRDLTLETDADISHTLRDAVDRAVSIEAVEEMEGDTVSRRKAIGLTILPSIGSGSDKPPKSVEELAYEQGLTSRPDYEQLADAVWENHEDFEEFLELLKEVRQAGSE